MNQLYALLRPQLRKQHTAWAVCLLLGLLAFSFAASAQSGKVFRDFNSNGVQDTPSTSVTVGEPGLPGVVVTGYPVTGSPVSATTGADGSYTLSGLSGQVRLEFTNLQVGDYDSFKGTGNGTSVQFVAAGSTANFGVNYPQNYCGKDTPPVLVPCYVSGDPQTGSDVGIRDVLVSLPYDSQGDTPTYTTVALAQTVGSVYGLAVLRSTQKLFSGAFLKRHVGLGPNGLGAIYLTNLTTNTTSLFTTLSAGSITRDALPITPPIASYDLTAYPLVGKAGLGDMEISDDEKTLYVVNLADRKLYSIPVSNPGNPTAGTPTSVAIPNPCGSGSYRPFALEYHRGKVYVGVVCTDESAADKTNNANVSGHVYSYDGNTFTEVLTFPLTYTRGATNDQAAVLTKWYPWGDDFYAAPYGVPGKPGGNPSYPQPWLTDIEFDVDGTMIIAIRDRFGDQTGDQNYGTDITDVTLYESISNGDILRAGRCGTADLYTLESDGATCGGTASAFGANGEGPGTGEFYDDNVFCCHNESSLGSLVLYPGKGEVVNTSLDPLNLYSGGLRFFNNADGTQNRQNGNGGDSHSSGVQLYDRSNVYSFGKANGLGDLELACNPAPIEIGNRVWKDTDKDGLQDANEAGIDGVTVQLYQGTTLVASTTTASGGQYYFNSTTTTGLLPNTAYTIKLGSTLGSGVLAACNGYSPLNTALAGNDANASGVVSVSTGNYGENAHTYDIGLTSAPICSLTANAQPTACVPATNQYSVNGTISLTSTAGGTAIITDGAVSASVTVAASATSVAYSLTGLVSDGASHSVTVSLMDCGSAVATYKAPDACTVAAPSLTVVVSTPDCNTATNIYTATGTVSLSNVVAGTTLTVTDNGVTVSTQSLSAGQATATVSLTGVSDASSHTVVATLTGGTSGSVTYNAPTSCTVCSLTFTTATLPNGEVGTAYSQTLTTTGGTAPLTFATIGGSLPAGLTLDATGVISGTPTSATTASFTVSVTDGKNCSAVAPLTITTSALPICSLTILADPDQCDPSTNTYLVKGTVSSTNAAINSASPQTLTVSVGSVTTTVTLTGDGPVSYTLAGLNSDGLVKTVTVTSSASACGMASVTYTAPVSCTVAPCNLAVTAQPSNCLSGTTTYNVTGTISFTNTQPGTYTVTDGLVQTTVTVSSTATASVPYTLTGLVGDGSSHTVVVTSTVCGSAVSQAYNAPMCMIPAVVTVNSTTVCAGAIASLTTTGCMSGTLAWSNAAGVMGISGTAITVATSATITTETILSYTVTCSTVSSTTSAVGTVTIEPIPSLSITASPSATVTAGSNVTLTATGCAGGMVEWSTNQTNMMSVVVTPITGSNSYSALCTTPAGCTGVASIIIKGSEPTSLVVTSVTVCAGDVATLNALGCKNGSVSWSLGTNPSSGTAVDVATAGLSGITSTTILSYTATCTNGSVSTAVATVTVLPLPSLTLTASPSATATVGSSVTLTATGCTGGMVDWSTAEQNVMSVVVSPALGSNTYSATCTTPSGCTGVASLTVVGTAPLTAGLGDKVFEDLNANGIQDTGEPGIANVTVTLAANGTTVTTTTNGSGIYSFTGLTPGVSYTVTFTAPAGYSATLQNVGPDDTNSDGNPTTGITKAYSLTANEFNPTVDMGYIRPASLGDKVFADNNNNGIQDLGAGGADKPIKDVTVILYINGVASATTTTASSGTGTGCYSFTGLTPGSNLSYSVGFTTPAGYTATVPNAAGSTPANDSDVSPITGRTGSITLASGEYNPTLDAGFILLPVASLSVSSATVCAGATASLSASGCTGSVTWSDNTSGNTLTVSTATLSGITSQTVLSYTATCTVGSSVTSAVGTVTVNPLPSLTITASPSQTVTAGTAVQLTVTGCTGGTINWTGGTTNPAVGATVSVIPMVGATNSYTATCTTASSCTGVASIIITGTQPNSLVVTSATVCAGEPASLMALGCTGTVNWSSGTNPTNGTLVTVSTAGLTGITSQTVLSYTATCTNGTTTTAISTVTVNPLPVITITASPGAIVTAGGSVTLTATGCMGGTVNWSTGQQNVMSAVVSAGSTASSTIYSATCITPSGCIDTESIEIMTLAAACNLAVTAVRGDCDPATNLYILTGSVSATGSVGVSSVTVSSGGQSVVLSLNGNGPVSYTLSGLVSDNSAHTVSVVSSASSCGSASVTYTAPQSCSTAPPIQITITSATVCAGQTATLSVSGCTGTVTWSAAVGAPGTSPSTGTLVTVSTTGLIGITSQTVLSYTAICVAGGSSGTAIGTVTVTPLPSMTLTASAPSCSGATSLTNGTVTLAPIGNISTAGLTYQYSIGGTAFNPATAQPIPAATIQGSVQIITNATEGITYWVRVTNQLGCSNEFSVMVPFANCGCPPPVCVPISIQRVSTRAIR